MLLRGQLNLPGGSLTSGTTYNLCCGTAPANQRIAVTGFGFFGAYNAAATPGLLQFGKATSGGVAGTAIVPLPLDPECTETFQSTWLNATGGTAPTSITVFDSRYVNPQLGLTELWDERNYIMIKGGGFFVLQFTPQQTTTYGGWVRIIE